MGWNQGPVPPERAKTGGRGLGLGSLMGFRRGTRGSEGFCWEGGWSPAKAGERSVPCFGPEEEPGPDSHDRRVISSSNWRMIEKIQKNFLAFLLILRMTRTVFYSLKGLS